MEQEKKQKRTTRKESTRITLYLLPEEKAFIDTKAKELGVSSNEFIRASIRGQKFPSFVDQKSVEELVKLRADLGRLGGLLKLWLTDDVKTQRFNTATIYQLLGRINDDMGSLRSYVLALWKKLSQQ